MGTMLEQWWQDIRYGTRMLLKKPGFTTVAVLTLALGMGANSAIFSVINAVLLRPLPYRNPDRLVRLQAMNPEQSILAGSTSAPDFIDWQKQSQVLDQLAAFVFGGSIITGVGEPERVAAAGVTGAFFSVIGVTPILGRAFLSDEDQSATSDAVILSYSLWQRRFGADPAILGRTLTINRKPLVVVGVMPVGFDYPEGSELWTSLGLEAHQPRSSRFLEVIARLKPGVRLEQARAEMLAIAGRLAQEYPQTNKGWSVEPVPLQEWGVRKIRPALLTLFGAAGFVLLIASVNVVNLLLARATDREKEFAVRAALGASRLCIVRQLITESMLLSLLGGGLGLAVALWGGNLLIALSPANLPRLTKISLDGGMLGFTVLVSILTGVIVGLVPALEASKLDVNELLRENARSGTGGSRHRLRSLLVISEVAFSLVLLIGAVLLIRSFLRLENVDPGFNPANILTMRIVVPGREGHQRASFFQEVIGSIEALPGVRSVGAALSLPLRGGGFYATRSFVTEGHSLVPDEEATAAYRVVTQNYFRAMGIQILKGRPFTELDTPNSPAVVIINETLARRFWPRDEAVGKKLTLWRDERIPREVVGVVGDIKSASLEAAAEPEIYVPHLQDPTAALTLVIRTTGDPLHMVGAVRDQVRAVDSNQPVYDIKTMEQILSASIAQRRFITLLLTLYGAIALLLAAIGIYGVTAYSVTRRANEIGIRIALGARATDVVKLIVGQEMLLVVIGVGIGQAGALGLTRFLAAMLFEVSATDPGIFISVPLLLGIVALISSYLPARKVTKADPVIALRCE